MSISVPESAEELKAFVAQLDKLLLDKAVEWAKACYKSILEKLDKLVAEDRDKRLSIEHVRGVWCQTCLGPVRIERRQYRDEQGGRRYLLDEIAGMGKHRHITNQARETVFEFATAMPYRRSSELLRKASPMDLPHQTIWRLVAQAADPWLKEADKKLRWFLETGEIPDGEEKELPRLMLEADGVMLSLQRERRKKAEVKLAIAYEGWAKVGRKDRHRTVNKTIFADVAGERDFWAGMTLKLEEKYDLSRVKDTIVGGDGAGWVREGADYMKGRYQLDRYHLNRELLAAFGEDNDLKRTVREECDQGNVQAGLDVLAGAIAQATGERAQRLRAAYGYLSQNSSGLGDYRLALGEEGKCLRRTGAIEGNVDKLVARRMKNQGMSWTIKGIRRLLAIRFLVLEGKLGNWLRAENEQRQIPDLPKRKFSRICRRALTQDPAAWLGAGLPALHGPHFARPWAKALKTLAEARPL